MRFMTGIVLAGVVVVATNIVFVVLALQGYDPIEVSYTTEAR